MIIRNIFKTLFRKECAEQGSFQVQLHMLINCETQKYGNGSIPFVLWIGVGVMEWVLGVEHWQEILEELKTRFRW